MQTYASRPGRAGTKGEDRQAEPPEARGEGKRSEALPLKGLLPPGGGEDVRLSRLPQASVFYILDRILEAYPEDFRAWLEFSEVTDTKTFFVQHISISRK